MSSGNVMEMQNNTKQWEGEGEWEGGEKGVHDLPEGIKSKEYESSKYPTSEIEDNVASKVHSHSIGTPTGKSERRSVGKFIFSFFHNNCTLTTVLNNYRCAPYDE
jgi:hypothetical protein